MADRDGRIMIFKDSMKLCDENEYLRQSIRMSLDGQKIHWENKTLNPIIEKRYKSTEMLVNNKRTCEAVKDYNIIDKNICILNFASFVTPGGGVTRGTTAQEESICRISTLYKCIADESVRLFYDSHLDKIRSKLIDRRNNDDIIFTPDVTIFKADTFDCEMLPEEEWYNVSVITCAAPDLRITNDGSRFSPTDDELFEVHVKRWHHILTVAAMYKTDILILGAFGCGVFSNSPWIVARAVAQVCKDFDGIFDKIVFAVYINNFESENYRAFSSICVSPVVTPNIPNN